MRLHFTYIFIGISTLALNLILTLHIIRRQRGAECKKIRECNDVITFSLIRGGGSEGETISAASCDDTVPLE